MKRQMKIAAVVSATALLAIGASFTSMAAQKNGTWALNDEGWQYVDKEGEYVESEWCYSNGIQYWINDEGVLGCNEWVSDSDGYTYYAQSDGSMTVNAWKYLYAEEEEDDVDAEEHWFYFDAKGRMVTNAKKQIGDYYYYFDKDGKMLTGWVDITETTATASNAKVHNFVEVDGVSTLSASNVVYCYEDGSLAKTKWIHVFPWTEDSDNCYEGDDEVWYYTKSSGAPNTDTIKTIDGEKYIFGANGQMLTEWVIKTIDSNNNTHYNETESKFTAATVDAAYYCDANDGHVKKGGWKELDDPTENDTFWYNFDNTGKVFLATNANTIYKVTTQTFDDGENYKVTDDTEYTANLKKVGSTYYYFNQYGEMIDGLVTVTENTTNAKAKLMYLKDGARYTGKVTLEDELENEYTFYFGGENSTDKGYEKYVAVTGNVGGYLYNNGQLVKSTDNDLYLEKSVTNPVTNKSAKFIVNYLGKIQHKDNKEYEGVSSSTNYTYNSNTKGWDAYSVVETTN